ncbi:MULTISPECIES: serine hydrolase domain-containing protein [Pseudonocardia]|uniref:Penicillin-binding protein 4 n=2 Tax=Pseudonocardia TaxID=1847 RepID=A0A1Y2MJW6_PSEAH|nr:MULTISPECIES: serine hydrolase domain-containing protein [Pseudonocardia]OSY35351.1 Penicillin-binding protein 4* [Pseudonocardia autotrophica]TDN75483.1 CubicO group peptidase (beta-lactamase class C family) [Pseudonocardia autotrophica]BBF99449.1 serine hydrolase [Pseudonocardia autotrophica]GEC28535.1 serine hydrolase [Pseudonocardia saturnea]
MTGLAPAVRRVLDWPVDHVAATVVAADGAVLAEAGDTDREFPLASVTKLLSAYAVLVAVEEGALDWADPAGPEGSTVRHLIAHTSGLAFDSDRIQAAPGERRIYSNTGFAVLADAVAEATGIGFADYLHQAVCEPLGLSRTRLEGAAGAGAVSTAQDLSRFAAELQAPRLLDPRTVAEATTVAYPGLDGLLPGYGRQKPNDWGLGFEIRDGKSPHWTGEASSPRTFGHFGQSGTFLWVDPAAGFAAVVLTDRDFGQWAVDAWPAWTDAVLAAQRA